MLKRKLKRSDERYRYFSEIERSKDTKTRKAKKVIRKYKITNVIDIPSIEQELKQKIHVKI